MSYAQINPNIVQRKEAYLGERFTNGEHLAGEKRCDYCGKWFPWSEQNIEKYLLERRWDAARGEPVHCGNSHCWDYHIRWLTHVRKMNMSAEYRESNFVERKKREGQSEQKAMQLYNRLKAKGVVA
jgi:hypothetical protein